MRDEIFYKNLREAFGPGGSSTATKSAAVSDLAPGWDVIYEEIMSGNERVRKAFSDLVQAKAEHEAACRAWSDACTIFESITDLTLPKPTQKAYQPERHTDRADTVTLGFRDRTVRLPRASVSDIAKAAVDGALNRLPTVAQLRQMSDNDPKRRDIATKAELHRRYPGEFEYKREFELALAAGLI